MVLVLLVLLDVGGMACKSYNFGDSMTYCIANAADDFAECP